MQRSRDVDSDEYDDDDDIPLHFRKPFGTGLKRQRVEFVPAQQPEPQIGTTQGSGNGAAAADLYASIVLGRKANASAASSTEAEPSSSETVARIATVAEPTQGDSPVTCTVCMLPITTTLRQHEASLAHQVSLSHSHPPSALDRSRMGLRHLASRGWDPDARKGLGREEEGMRFPIKTVLKEDKMGIGAVAPDPEELAREEQRRKEQQPKKLSGKELRLEQARERKKAEKLQAEIFGRVDVDRYLRGDGSDQL